MNHGPASLLEASGPPLRGRKQGEWHEELVSLEVSRAMVLLQGCGGGWGTGVEEVVREVGDQVPSAPIPSAPLPNPGLPAAPPAPCSACARFRFRKVALVLVRGREVDCEKRDRVKRNSEASSGVACCH